MADDESVGELKRLAFESSRAVLSPTGEYVLAGVGSTHHSHSGEPFMG
jgi:hypothetical protein